MNISVEMNGILNRLRARVGFETRVANGQGERACGQSGFAQAFTGFLGEMAQQGFHFRDVGGVFTKSVIVGNRFGFRIDQEFVGIASAGFAIERGAPLAKDFLKFLLFVSGELFDSLNAERTKGALRDFTDARNFANGQWSEKARFHSWRNPNQAARFGLIGRNFRD